MFIIILWILVLCAYSYYRAAISLPFAPECASPQKINSFPQRPARLFRALIGSCQSVSWCVSGQCCKYLPCYESRYRHLLLGDRPKPTLCSRGLPQFPPAEEAKRAGGSNFCRLSHGTLLVSEMNVKCFVCVQCEPCHG